MDVNKLLADMRVHVELVRQGENVFYNGMSVKALFVKLDEYLSNGGSLPDAWQPQDPDFANLRWSFFGPDGTDITGNQYATLDSTEAVLWPEGDDQAAEVWKRDRPAQSGDTRSGQDEDPTNRWIRQ